MTDLPFRDPTLTKLLASFVVNDDQQSVTNTTTLRRYPFPGQKAADGHYYIRIGTALVDVGRAIYALTYKKWPTRLQRRDGNPYNLHISNLVDLPPYTGPVPNSGDTRQYVGVFPYPANRSKPWRVGYYKKNQGFTLGYYQTEREAASAYDRMVFAIEGGAARLNFPTEKLAKLGPIEQKTVDRVMAKLYPALKKKI
jgi:hypothetical protein